MQLGKRSRNGDRTFMRTNEMIVVNKRGKVRVVMGIGPAEKKSLRTGTPSTFNQLGKA